MNTMKSVAVTLVVTMLCSTTSTAATLPASSFSSLGYFESVPGVYQIDTDTLTMSGPAGFLATGTAENGIAVFAFDRFSLGNGATLTTIGGLPAAIHSASSLTVGGDGIRALSGGGLGGEPRRAGQGPGGGRPGFNFFGGAGGGGGFGGAGGRGHCCDPTFQFPGSGGPAYGDLDLLLQAGSGGGGAKDNSGFESAGGDGGGALELAAGSFIRITSSVRADGEPGQPRGSNHAGGGGGSGGGLSLRAARIFNSGTISASGGRGGDGIFENGGGGGGGRILIDSSVGGFSNNGVISVAGGASPSDFFGTGSPGTLGVVTIRTTIVPEPNSLLLIGLGSLLITSRASCMSRGRRGGGGLPERIY